MSDDKPNAGEDVKKAFGLLFRAAKTAVDQLPTKKFEDAVTLGAKEVGRAIENVAGTIEKEFFPGNKANPGSQAQAAPPNGGDAPQAQSQAQNQAQNHAQSQAQSPSQPPQQQTRIAEDPPKEPPAT